MGIKIGSYVLEANAVSDVSAFCLKLGAKSPKAGITYQSIGFGADNAFIITSKGKVSISEALSKGMIEITGANDYFGDGDFSKLMFKNNTGEQIKFEVTDDFVLKTKNDEYSHVPKVLNNYESNLDMWDALEPFQTRETLTKVNKTSSNQLLKVTYVNEGHSIQYKIENGQNDALYVGNNFKEIADKTNIASNNKQNFIFKDFPSVDKETGFLRSVENANQKIPGFKAIKFSGYNLEKADILLAQNPKLIKTTPIKEIESFWDNTKYQISAEVSVNNKEFEIIAKADKKGLLTTWITNIKSLFGIKRNSLNDILNKANKTIKKMYPKEKYNVSIDDYHFSFTIREKKVENTIAKL